jgi:hypothetical protein
MAEHDETRIPTQAGPVTQTPELSLSLDDSDLLDLIQRKRDEYEALLSEKKVRDRSERMVRYWKGTQEGSKRTGAPEKAYRNNVIHRDLATRIQNATGRMPDIVVMSPSQDSDPSVKEQTRQVEEWLSIRLDSDATRRLAQGAVRDNHLKLRGIWGYRYDPFRKDAVIERKRPDDIILDATARIPEDGYTCDNMEYIGEWVEDFTSSALARFPDKASELLDELDREARAKNAPRSSKIRYLMSTARVSKEDGTPALILVYSYNRILLSKAPHPYWDEREGSAQEFGEVPENVLHPDLAAALPGLGLKAPLKKSRRFNHFPFPRMPYSVFSGENLGDGPLDDTTVVEQALPLQDIVNVRGDQITAINDWAIPKVVVSTSAMTEEKASSISRDPSEIVTVKVEAGQSVESVFSTFTGEAASPALYGDLEKAVQAIDSFFSTNPVTRGETVTQESGVSKQISREGDLSSADDIAQTMVQRPVEEAANWLVQLAKIYFDEPTAATSYGSDRSLRKASVSRDMIPDDMQIVVKANAVDKMTQRNLMMNLVTSQGVDPYNLYQALGFPNPKELTVDLINFLNKESDGGLKYLDGIGANPAAPANEQNEGQGDSPTPPPAPPQVPQPPQAGPPPGPPSVPQAPPEALPPH